jgi:hypothetical protein
MWQSMPGVYGWYGFAALCGGYALVMLFNPVRQALGDGFRCIGRYKRIWITFALLGFGYFVFQFATFTPIRNWADLDPSQIISLPHWYWPRFTEVWRKRRCLPWKALRDFSITPPPRIRSRLWRRCSCCSTGAVTWRASPGIAEALSFLGLPGLFDSVAERAGVALKPIVFWQLPEWSGLVPAAGLLRISATVDASAFILNISWEFTSKCISSQSVWPG